MIWHIFKKDLRLLWPMAALVAGMHVLNAGLLIGGGQFERSSTGGIGEFGWVSNIALPGVALLGLAVLVMAVIQQDRLPGTTQDWLTRPIPRSQLFVAKLLFVALTGLLPILVADLAMGLAEQLSVADVVASSLARSAVLFCLVCLPAALIGLVTRTLTEALVLVVAVGVLLFIEFLISVQIHPLPMAMIQSGYGWIAVPVLAFLNVCALLILLPLQLRWRSTNRVRWVLAAYCCLLPAVALIPWDAAFQVHRTLESRNVATAVSITLDASRKITFTPTPSFPGRPPKSEFVMLRVPVVVSNLGPGNWVYVDRVKLHSIEPERPGSERGPSNEDLSQLNQFGFVLDRSLDRGKASPEIDLTVPFDSFNAARAAHSRIELQLLATKLRLTAQKSLQSLAATGSIDDHGRCYRQSIVRFGRSSEVFQCVSARPIGNCFEVNDPARRLRNTGIIAYRCGASTYAPWPLPLWRDAYYTVLLTADDWQQPVRADTSSEAPRRSDVIVSNYIPDVHVVRTLDFEIGAAIEKARVENRTADGMGPAARFASPTGVVADRRGNLFVVDEVDSVIRKVTPAGEVGTFAGAAGQKGSEDGVAQEARFSRPHGIAIDSADNLFVADTGNGLIRKITPAGIVSTLMGNTSDKGNHSEPLRFKNLTGVVCAPDGSLYVIDSNAVTNGNPVVRKVSPAGVVTMVAGPEEPTSNPYNRAVLEMPDE